ncbi:MAG: DUF2242 domain-containing protein [Oxalobacter sp.]|nr:MAG: DUF2242 domain-containing protein [Oxalobacter sp.]
MKKSYVGFLAILVIGLSACSSTKQAFLRETFDSKGPFDRHYPASKQVVYESMKRVALRQGFSIEQNNNKELTIVVSKQYQEGELNTLLTISGLVTGSDAHADAWVAAQEVTLKNHIATQTASVGLGFGLSLPVPTGKVSTLSKERGETIMDKTFYQKIFAAIEKEIPVVKQQMQTTAAEDDSRLRADIEKKLRIEMEIRERLEKERHAAKSKPAPEKSEILAAKPDAKTERVEKAAPVALTQATPEKLEKLPAKPEVASVSATPVAQNVKPSTTTVPAPDIKPLPKTDLTPGS